MQAPPNLPRLYRELAWLWPLWGSLDTYADYCAQVHRLIQESAQIPAHSLLNLGCGGGKNVFSLKRAYAVTGLDVSPQMLALAQSLNPECEFLQGDMRQFDLGRTFDAVLVDDAIAYMTTRSELRAVFAAAWHHLNPGGVMVVTPDTTRETFVQNQTMVTPANPTEPPSPLAVIFVENNYDPDPEDDQFEGTMVYLIRDRGELRIECDRHIFGLFSLAVWREILTEIGFIINEMTYNEQGTEYTMFGCIRPS